MTRFFRRLASVRRAMRHHRRPIAAVAAVIGVLAIVAFTPSFSFAAGNVFFGEVPLLYNVQLAQFYFTRAAYPLIGVAPRYAHYQLSRTDFIEGNLYEALDEARKELALYPDDTSTYYILGLTYGYLNRSYEAIDSFSQYIETHPDTWAGRNDKAWLQFRVGDIDGALETIEPIAKNFRYTVWVQNTYCALLINKGRYADAETACTYAKEAADKMTAKDWGHAYPGNDPRVYDTGLEAMRDSIAQNLALIRRKLGA